MQQFPVTGILAAALAVGSAAAVPAIAQTGGFGSDTKLDHKLELTPAQKSAIYREVSKDKNKAAPTGFPAVIGAEVPPMIELYTLPDDTLAANPAAAFYKYTVVQDRVVLVDPTRMRVVDVIGPMGK